MGTLDKSSPTEIVDQVMCGYTVETAHPFFESDIAVIEIQRVIGKFNHTNQSILDTGASFGHLPGFGKIDHSLEVHNNYRLVTHDPCVMP